MRENGPAHALEQLIAQLNQRGALNGEWERCFDQLAIGMREVLAAFDAREMQLIAETDQHKATAEQQSQQKLTLQLRVRSLEQTVIERDRVIATLQQAGGTVLAEIRRLRVKYGEPVETRTASGTSEAA